MDVKEKAKEIRRLWSGYWQARAIITANNLEVFEHLKEKRTAAQVARKTKTDARATGILLDALTGMGFLKKTKDLYVNTKDANVFFIRGQEFYQGDIVRHADSLWKSWSQLDEVVRSGKPAKKERSSAGFESFILGMHNLARLKAGPVIKAVGLKGVKSALDLGGGPGTYALEMERQGVADVALFDMPDTIKIAGKHLRKLGAKGIRFIKGDFHRDDIGGGYDLVLMSNILHSNSPEDCRMLLKKAAASLNAGGRAVIHEFYLGEDHATPLSSALFSINMLVNTPGGRCYSFSEYKSFMRAAGIGNVTQKILGDSIIVEGRAK
ncbi:MAG: methyltransferase [Nitrospiraceae bacterium]|nr:methyltransferase [Nitrospiraceae bacterium]